MNKTCPIRNLTSEVVSVGIEEQDTLPSGCKVGKFSFDWISATQFGQAQRSRAKHRLDTTHPVEQESSGSGTLNPSGPCLMIRLLRRESAQVPARLLHLSLP